MSHRAGRKLGSWCKGESNALEQQPRGFWHEGGQDAGEMQMLGAPRDFQDGFDFDDLMHAMHEL